MERNYHKNAQVAHAWAHGHGTDGQGSHFFFDGNTIYSYGRHFPIATIDGHRVFFTEQQYSKTTAIHKSIALSAVSHKRVIYVHEVPEHGNPSTNSFFHQKNINYWIAQIKRSVAVYEENPRRKICLADISLYIRKLEGFVEELGIQPSAELKAILANKDVQQLAGLFKAAEAKKAAAKKRAEKKALKKYLQDLAEWENHTRQKLGLHPVDAQASLAFLRVTEDGKYIETSKDVKVPVELALRFWRYIQRVLPNGCMNCAYSILDFNVDRITPEEIRVGCHTIPMAQAEKIAHQLNW